MNMFANLRTIVSAGGDLFRSEGTILLERFRRVVLWSGLFAAAALVLIAAAVALSVAATAALATEIGWIPALTIAGACALGLSIAALAYARRSMTRQLRRSEMPIEPRTTSILAKQEIADALPGGEPDAAADGGDDGEPASGCPADEQDLAAKVTKFVTDHPAEIAGGAVAVLGLIGPVRSFRLLSKGVMLAGIARSISKQMSAAADAAEAPAAGQPQEAPNGAAAAHAARASARH